MMLKREAESLRNSNNKFHFLNENKLFNYLNDIIIDSIKY